MAELPPPTPGQPAGPSGWQPPAGPPPAPPAPADPPADPAVAEVPVAEAPVLPLAPAPPAAADPLPEVDFEAFDRSLSLSLPPAVPSAPPAPTLVPPTAAPSTVSSAPTGPAPTISTAPTGPAAAANASGPPSPSKPPKPSQASQPPKPSKPSRVPAVVGALVAVALGFAAMLWLTRGSDADSNDSSGSSGSSGSGSATDDASDAATPASAATIPPTVVQTTVPAPTTTEPPAAPSTEPPAAPLATEPPATTPLETVPVPGGATPYADPAGWTILVEPTWRFEQSPNFTGWFTNTGSQAFTDNVNVVTEPFSQPFTLDEYVDAALRQITVQAPDAQVTDQRRVVGQDGREVELVTWSGTLPGLPPLVFLQAITVTPDRAYIATFTTEIDRMPTLGPVVAPYLASIRPA